MGRFSLSPQKDFTVKAEVMGMLLFLCRTALCPFPQSLECLFLMNITGSFFSDDILEQRRTKQGFPGGSAAKNLPAMQEPQETRVLFLGWEDSPGGGYGNSLQYSCLENPMDRGDWQITVHMVTESQT